MWFLLFLLINPVFSGIYIDKCNRKWGNGCIPVVLEESIEYRKDDIIDAIDILNTATNSALVLYKNATQTGIDYDVYLSVYRGSGCSSYVGKITPWPFQRISIASGCRLYSIVHEFMHAIGINHEQSRPDRDNYITVNFTNIYSPSLYHNFYKRTGDSIPPAPYDDYDYSSIMHYGEFAFAKCFREECKTIDAMGNDVGQRERLSPLDIQTINYALLECEYNEPISPSCTDLCVPACRNDGVCVNNECDCTGTGYVGQTCSELVVCNPVCLNGGICVDNECECPEAYTGIQCEILDCGCQNGGECLQGNICDCTNTGYVGAKCEVPVCEERCRHGGTCIRPNECDCTGTDYTGNDCSIAVCNISCENGATCTRPNECDCTNTGYTGTYCNIPICDPYCKNGGLCVGPNECDCTNTGYNGTLCENPKYEIFCQNNGTFILPDKCNCTETGYEGVNCEIPVCEPECEENGKCVSPNNCEYDNKPPKVQEFPIITVLIIFIIFILCILFIGLLIKK